VSTSLKESGNMGGLILYPRIKKNGNIKDKSGRCNGKGALHGFWGNFVKRSGADPQNRIFFLRRPGPLSPYDADGNRFSRYSQVQSPDLFGHIG
jgi:hypothetical protein